MTATRPDTRRAVGVRAAWALSMAAPCALAIAALVATMPARAATSERRALDERGHEAVAWLAAAATLSAGDARGPDALPPLLSRVVDSSPALVYAVVADARGNAIASVPARDAPAFVRPPRFQAGASTRDGVLHVATSVSHAGRTEVVAVGVTLASVGAARQAGYRDALIASTLVLLAALIAGAVGWRWFATPLVSLADELSTAGASLTDAVSAAPGVVPPTTTASGDTLSTLGDTARELEAAATTLSNTVQDGELATGGLADHVHDLTATATRVVDTLDVIMQVADRADLLALNAALEGTKAGEAGEGFTLVADEMRRLAATLMDTVGDVRSLIKQLAATSGDVAGASQEGQRSIRTIARSAQSVSELAGAQRGIAVRVAADVESMVGELSRVWAAARSVATHATTVDRATASLRDVVAPRKRRTSNAEPQSAKPSPVEV